MNQPKQVTHVLLPVALVEKVLHSLGERTINQAVNVWLELKATADASHAAQMQEGSDEQAK